VDVVSCPLLPLAASGGFVGMLTVKVAVEVGDVNYEPDAAIIFWISTELVEASCESDRILGR
jgi:hypothetical protein